MKVTTLLFFLTLTVVWGQTPENNSFEKFEVIRGTNISHWLSQSKSRGLEREKFFTQKDVQSIAQMGFDHIDSMQSFTLVANFFDDRITGRKDAFILIMDRNCYAERC